jgi:hypothetical protein
LRTGNRDDTLVGENRRRLMAEGSSLLRDDDLPVRSAWEKPQLVRMCVGDAELGGDTNVDGDPGLS